MCILDTQNKNKNIHTRHTMQHRQLSTTMKQTAKRTGRANGCFNTDSNVFSVTSNCMKRYTSKLEWTSVRIEWRALLQYFSHSVGKAGMLRRVRLSERVSEGKKIPKSEWVREQVNECVPLSVRDGIRKRRIISITYQHGMCCDKPLGILDKNRVFILK